MTEWTDTYILSDTHGWFDLMIEMLTDAGLTDAEGNWIAADTVRLFHLGDTVDRGPDSVKTFEWLRDLQTQLGPERVVRLIGNHEFAFCGGPAFGGLDPKVHESGVPAHMVEDGKSGVLKFAQHLETHDGQWLLVHGGLDPRLLPEDDASTAQELADHINDVGLDFFNHHNPRWRMAPLSAEERDQQAELEKECALVTGISFVRGGYDTVSGVTWCDKIAELEPQEDKMTVRQIVGHRSHDQIDFTDGGKIIGVNVHYGTAQLLRYDHEAGEFSVSKLFHSETHKWDDWRGPLWK